MIVNNEYGMSDVPVIHVKHKKDIWVYIFISCFVHSMPDCVLKETNC